MDLRDKFLPKGTKLRRIKNTNHDHANLEMGEIYTTIKDKPENQWKVYLDTLQEIAHGESR